ncbi:MAG: hypothetical protein M3R17_10165 [Bacteroidota bacterium]|nr:hypothetical protein [Bacteroidota bacterium]
MADKKISQLTEATTLTANDTLVLVNSLQTKKATIETLLAFIDEQVQFANLDVNGKVPISQIPASLIGASTYQSAWNASTDSPAIPTAATANKGWYYVVSTAGTTSVSGITDWKVGDWIISNGSAWEKVDNTDALTSWNGRVGAVVPVSGDYNTDLVTEATNKYYTAARVLAEALTGLSTQNAAIASTDSVVVGFGKAQGQINVKENSANKGVAGGYASLGSDNKHLKAEMQVGSVANVIDFTGYSAPAGTAENILFSRQIAAGVLAAGNQFSFNSWYGATSNANNKTLRIYFNTSNSLSGATLIGTLVVTTNSASTTFGRTCGLISDTSIKNGVAGTVSSAGGAGTTVFDPGITVPSVSAGFWVIVSGQKAVSGDVLKLERVLITTAY